MVRASPYLPETALRRAMTMTLLLCAAALPALAAEGMWTLDNLPTAALRQRYGFAPDAAWVDKVMQASVRLAGGCSGSFVSAEGLVMTNHHCAAPCIDQLSSAQVDRSAAGFLARTRDEELRCPEIELNRLEQIVDVTDRVRQATAGRDGTAFQAALDAVRADLTRACKKDDAATRCDLVTLYHGGQYRLYRYHRFDDVRLVWAPESDIANFGGDPDNFNFPRYDLDVSMLRAYEHGRPAVVRDFLRLKPAGAQPGELTFVLGHPGHTDRQLTVAQLETLRDRLAVETLPRGSELRGLLIQYGRGGAEPLRTSLNDLFYLENSVKVWRGQLQALSEPSFWAARREAEQRLVAFVASRPELKAQVGDPWSAIAVAQQRARELWRPYRLLSRGDAFATSYFRYARLLVRGAAERAKPDAERLREFAEAGLPEQEQLLASSAPVYPALEAAKLGWSLSKLREGLGADDALVRRVLGKEAPDALAARWVTATRLGEPAERMRLWRGGQAAIDASNDPFIRLAIEVDAASREIRSRYESEVEAVEQKNSERIAAASFAQTGTGAYPDATFTLRLSYGEVRGWNERGMPVPPYTEVAGVFARATGADPFRLPPSWLAAEPRLDPRQRFNFVTTNDIIGGNSGSPMIDRHADIVGLVFDGNLASLGGSYAYDESVNRAVAVHPGVLVEALRKVYDAGFLADELLGRPAR
jgi:hypothetical protein